MPLYEVSLSRAFIIKVEAKSAQDAAKLSEFYLGYADESTELDRERYGFEFKDIDLTVNDAIVVSKVNA